MVGRQNSNVRIGAMGWQEPEIDVPAGNGESAKYFGGCPGLTTFRRKIQFSVVGVNSAAKSEARWGASGLENRLTVGAC
jgi:hypothetical protein